MTLHNSVWLNEGGVHPLPDGSAPTALTPIANVVDTSYTVVAMMASNHLPGVTVMGGGHRRLRGS